MMPTHQHLGYRRKPHHTPVAVVTKYCLYAQCSCVLAYTEVNVKLY